MAERLTREIVAEKAIVHTTLPALARPRHQVDVDRGFELPSVLYAATAGMFLAFLAVMAAGFAHPEMILPMAIFTIFIVGFFGVPALWVRMKPDHADRAKSWSRFIGEGVQTYTGHCKGRDAAVLVLLLPAIVLMWGIATVTIAAIVR